MCLAFDPEEKNTIVENLCYGWVHAFFGVSMRSRQHSSLARTFLELCLILGITTTGHAEKRALLIGIYNYAPPPGAAIPAAGTQHAADSRFAPGTSWRKLQGPPEDVASMRILLQDTYSFNDANITVVPEENATRAGILAAIDKLVADTMPGDFVVFYYAGHGSQRLDTLSSKNHLDETIVPIDAWKGEKDIRDKEMAIRFDKIVFDKHAHLTAIYDSCDSGTMARGVTESVQRALAYDDRDVADDKTKDPSTVTEADLDRLPRGKRIPQDGDAIILAAAAANESAQEAKYPDDHKWHGAFTRALVRVLQSSTQALSAEDVVAEVSSMLHADSPSPVPFQQPSVEGRLQQSLFGDPVGAHALHVRVTKVPDAKLPADTVLKLDVGSAAGFDIGTQFTAIEADAGGKKTVIEVKSVDEPLVSSAQVISGPGAVKVGQIFELTKMMYPQAARLVIFASKAQPAPDVAAIAKTKALFPGLKWVGDPTTAPLDYLVVEQSEGWSAFGQSGAAVRPGPTAKGTAFLLVGPPQMLLNQIQNSAPFQTNAFSFTQKLADANYLLAARMGPGGKPEYALFDPIILAPRKPNAYVRSAESDVDDAELNGGINPEIVCRNDVSLPVRTAWLHDRPGSPEGSDVALALTRRVVRLGKLRVWLKSAALAPGIANWPYHLTLTQPNSDVGFGSAPLRPGQRYDVRLVAHADVLASHPPVPKYVYLFGFDCSANAFVLFPQADQNGSAMTPQALQDGSYPPSVVLFPNGQGISNPIGADTIFFMASQEKLTNPNVITNDGVLMREGTRGVAGGFDELMSNMNDAGTRGFEVVPTHWTVQELVIPSRP